MECYICWGPTADRSPCLCRAPCHKKCLGKWLRKRFSTRCSICRGELDHPAVQRYLVLERAERASKLALVWGVAIATVFGEGITDRDVRLAGRVALTGVLLTAIVAHTILGLVRQRLHVCP